MAKRSVKGGSTGQRELVWIGDSTSTSGAGKTGLAYNTAGLKAYYIRPGGSATAITLATQTVTGAFSSGGFVEVDATNMPGLYRFDIPDAVFASGVEKAVVVLSGAAGMAPVPLEYDLVSYDPYDGVRAGLTALPNVASGSAGAIITSGTGTAQLSVSSGAVTVGTNNDKTGYSLTQTFPANFNSLAITAGGSVTAGTVSDKTGYSLSGSQTFSTSGSVGSVTGAVGSVTGSVGSVTGNVGGNVVGSVGSVVGTVTANTTQLAGQTVTAAAGVTFPTTVSSLTAAGVRTELSTELGRIDASVSSRSTLTAANVWQTDVSGYTTAGHAGTYLKGAGSSGDPWSTAIPGTYGAGTAGYILGTNLNATITSRLATSGYTAPLDAAGTRSALGLAAANLDTQLDALPTATENAAAVWNALVASYVVNGSFGERVLRSTNTQAEVQVNGNGHVASVLHSSEANSITVGAFAADSITGSALAASAATEIATATLGATVEGSETLVQAVRLVRAALVGKLSGAATTTVTIRDAADSKNRITATVTADGNRTDVTTDAT